MSVLVCVHSISKLAQLPSSGIVDTSGSPVVDCIAMSDILEYATLRFLAVALVFRENHSPVSSRGQCNDRSVLLQSVLVAQHW